MKHIKETPRLVKYGNKIPIQVNSTIHKKVLTSVCKSGILEEKIKDELTIRDRQVRVTNNEERHNEGTKAIENGKVTDRNVRDNSTINECAKDYTERTTTKKESTRKSRQKKIKPKTTSDQQ